ncbi:nicotianamine synthase family protein [Peribacillus asahii]|uniref:nicotianamine synthase family protein n=1 Tax=Peribacillus asahii TaxID=228899 RepID=UPI00207A05FA|nr:nicotianamine synthase family protein [Peribacillus asahii]USK68301.1 hypothetical protein LIS76_11720 [Peribacillus asahii]
MKEKYKFLLSLRLLEYEIKELMVYSEECRVCFELLKKKLDDLCQFVICEDNLNQWQLWGCHSEVKKHSERLRETSVKALCAMEKYQSICTCNNELNLSDYINALSNSVKRELDHFCIDDTSKVLFIGSGAFPTSALTIAQEAGAKVVGLDIDNEAVELAKKVTKVSGLESRVRFSSESLYNLDFVKEATHIIIASLVRNKLEVLESLRTNINLNAKIILRYGNGLKSAFNYPLEKDLSPDWIETKISESKNIYDTIMLEKSSSLFN